MAQDLDEKAAEKLAGERFGAGASVKQEGNEFVVYQLLPVELPRPAGRETQPLTLEEVAIGRGKTRREAIANAKSKAI
jgi:hypothetical protein